MQLTYYEFAKEELETLDTGAPTTGSSFTTSSSDSGQVVDQQAPDDSANLDQDDEQAQQREDAGINAVGLALSVAMGLFAALTQLVFHGFGCCSSSGVVFKMTLH